MLPEVLPGPRGRVCIFWLWLVSLLVRWALTRPLRYVAEGRTAVRVRSRLYTATLPRQYISWLLLPVARAHPGRKRAQGRTPPSFLEVL